MQSAVIPVPFKEKSPTVFGDSGRVPCVTMTSCLEVPEQMDRSLRVLNTPRRNVNEDPSLPGRKEQPSVPALSRYTHPPFMYNSPHPSQMEIEIYPMDLLPCFTELPNPTSHNKPSFRESQVLPIEERQVEVIRMTDNSEKVAVGKVIQNVKNGESLEIKEVLRWERHAVIFYGCYPDFPGKEVILIARNEQVEWNVWRRIVWYLSFPLLQGHSLLSNSSV